MIEIPANLKTFSRNALTIGILLIATRSIELNGRSATTPINSTDIPSATPIGTLAITPTEMFMPKETRTPTETIVFFPTPVLPTQDLTCHPSACWNVDNLGGCPGGKGSEDNCGGVGCNTCENSK